MLNRLANSAGHIITIEDPVEYVHQHAGCIITQREIGVDSLSWEAALKSSLRQVPDVILIGEIRDQETMEHAISMAETGHLSLNFKAFVAQQLVPTVDGKRRAAIEILINTPIISALIKKGEVSEIKEIMAKSKEQGMQTFDGALYELYVEGLIS